MSERLASGVLVSALIRRAHQAGGFATVLAKGDPDGGAILLIGLEKGRDPRAWERGIGPDGLVQLIPAGPPPPATESDITAYWQRRRSRDSDLWVIELDVPSAERFAAETIG